MQSGKSSRCTSQRGDAVQPDRSTEPIARLWSRRPRRFELSRTVMSLRYLPYLSQQVGLVTNQYAVREHGYPELYPIEKVNAEVRRIIGLSCQGSRSYWSSGEIAIYSGFCPCRHYIVISGGVAAPFIGIERCWLLPRGEISVRYSVARL